MTEEFTFQSGDIQIQELLDRNVYDFIYIPIWWYSNVSKQNSQAVHPQVFTFQSGDIQINIINFNWCFWIAFTFQSGDIQI